MRLDVHNAAKLVVFSVFVDGEERVERTDGRGKKEKGKGKREGTSEGWCTVEVLADTLIVASLYVVMPTTDWELSVCLGRTGTMTMTAPCRWQNKCVRARGERASSLVPSSHLSFNQRPGAQRSKGEEDGIGYLCVKNNQGSRDYIKHSVLPSSINGKTMTNTTSLAMQFARVGKQSR